MKKKQRKIKATSAKELYLVNDKVKVKDLKSFKNDKKTLRTSNKSFQKPIRGRKKTKIKRNPEEADMKLGLSKVHKN